MVDARSTRRPGADRPLPRRRRHGVRADLARHHHALDRYARKVLGRAPSTPRTSSRRRCCARASRCAATTATSSSARGSTGSRATTALDELSRLRTDWVSTPRPRTGGVLRARAVERARGGRRGPLEGPPGPRRLAPLPANQRHALMRREVDGVSHAPLAVELGHPAGDEEPRERARTNLVKQREARTTTTSVRPDLLNAQTRGAAPRPRRTATSELCGVPPLPRRRAPPAGPRRS